MHCCNVADLQKKGYVNRIEKEKLIFYGKALLLCRRTKIGTTFARYVCRSNDVAE